MKHKVYIIVDGPEDHRSVCAAFSSRQAAEEALCYADERAEIIALEVDAALPNGPDGHSMWTISGYKGYSAMRMNAIRFPPEEDVRVDEGEYQVDVWARNKKQALQLGKERIERFKAGERA